MPEPTPPQLTEDAMNSDEREERLKQIRERRRAATLPANQRWILQSPSWVDIDFLLSEIERRPLRDSTGLEYHAMECGVDEEGNGCTCGACRRNQAHMRDCDAATRMRDKCVETALEFRAATTWADITYRVLGDLITKLQSLTLDQEEQEKQR